MSDWKINGRHENICLLKWTYYIQQINENRKKEQKKYLDGDIN